MKNVQFWICIITLILASSQHVIAVSKHQRKQSIAKSIQAESTSLLELSSSLTQNQPIDTSTRQDVLETLEVAESEQLFQLEETIGKQELEQAEQDHSKEEEGQSFQPNVELQVQEVRPSQSNVESLPFVMLVQRNVKVMKEVYQGFYSKLTNHLNGQRDVFIVILATIIVFLAVFFALSKTKTDFPFLHILDLQNSLQTKGNMKDKQTLLAQEDEKFYQDYENNTTTEHAVSLNQSNGGDSYLSASDFKLEKTATTNGIESDWMKMRRRAEQYSTFDNNPLNKEYKQRQLKKSKADRADDTIDFQESNFDINDILNDLDRNSINVSSIMDEFTECCNQKQNQTDTIFF